MEKKSYCVLSWERETNMYTCVCLVYGTLKEAHAWRKSFEEQGDISIVCDSDYADWLWDRNSRFHRERGDVGF